eukprot:962744-Pyramimonas_sp.AAC.1
MMSGCDHSPVIARFKFVSELSRGGKGKGPLGRLKMKLPACVQRFTAELGASPLPEWGMSVGDRAAQ